MSKETRRPGEDGQSGLWLAMVARYLWSQRGVRLSVGAAVALLAWDTGITGSCVASLILCPIWLVASLAKTAIQGPGWKLRVLRAAFPAVTLGVAVANSAFQLRVAETNAARIVAACEEFQAAHGRFPDSLEQLLPRYLPSIPRARYSLLFGEFVYVNLGKPMLVWYIVPPFGRKVYDFEIRRWRYID